MSHLLLSYTPLREPYDHHPIGVAVQAAGGPLPSHPTPRMAEECAASAAATLGLHPLQPASEGEPDEEAAAMDRSAERFQDPGQGDARRSTVCGRLALQTGLREPAPAASSDSQDHLEAGIDSAGAPHVQLQPTPAGGSDGAGGGGEPAAESQDAAGGSAALVSAAAATAAAPEAMPAAAAVVAARSPEWGAGLPVLPAELRPGVRHQKRDLPLVCQVLSCGVDLSGQAVY